MQKQLWFPQLARQQHSLFSKVTWWPVKHRFIGFCLIYGSCEQKLAQTAQTQFCCSLIPINLLLIAFIWLHLESDHFKNIWSEIEMMNWHCYTWYRGLKVKLPPCGSNFTRSWLPCEVNGASGWWVRFWRAGIEHGKSFAKQTWTHWFFLLKVNS